MHYLRTFLNHVLFLSCSLERTDPCCNILFGDLVYLGKRCLYKPEIFDTTVLVSTPRIRSLCSPQYYRKKCLASHPLLLSLCPEHWYNDQLLDLPSYSVCKLFSFLSSSFSKREYIFYICHENSLWWFLPPYGQLCTLSNTCIWAETLSFWKCYKINFSLNAGGRFQSPSSWAAVRAASTLLTILFHVLTPPTSLPSSLVACLLRDRLKMGQGHIEELQF